MRIANCACKQLKNYNSRRKVASTTKHNGGSVNLASSKGSPQANVVGHGPALEQIARDSANASCIVGALLANQVLQFARHHACCARPSTCGHQLWTGPLSISFSPTLRTRDEKECLWCLALVMSIAAPMTGGPNTQGAGRYAAGARPEFILLHASPSLCSARDIFVL